MTRMALQWGGAACLIISIVAYFVSRYYCVDVHLTNFENFGTMGGECYVTWRTDLHAQPFPSPDPPLNCNPMVQVGWTSTFSFERFGGTMYELMFPLWVTMILGGLAVALGLRMKKWVRPGVCSKCGYDRAGLTAALPCPECGRLEAGAGSGGDA
jgi:hypothetical protein